MKLDMSEVKINEKCSNRHLSSYKCRNTVLPIKLKLQKLTLLVTKREIHFNDKTNQEFHLFKGSAICLDSDIKEGLYNKRKVLINPLLHAVNHKLGWGQGCAQISPVDSWFAEVSDIGNYKSSKSYMLLGYIYRVSVSSHSPLSWGVQLHCQHRLWYKATQEGHSPPSAPS